MKMNLHKGSNYMQKRCQNCGNTKLYDDGKYYICEFCGEKISKESLDEITNENNKFINDYINRNEKLFSLDFNDDSLTKDELYKLAKEIKEDINKQQDDNLKTVKEGILTDIYEKIYSFLPERHGINDINDDNGDFISKLNKCNDLDDLFEKGNTLRRLIEKSFYNVKFKNQPLFENKKGKAAITKEKYIEFIDYLLTNGKINKDDANYYKERVINNKIELIKNDRSNRISADMGFKFLSLGLKKSEISKSYRIWKLLNACSHSGTEDEETLKKLLLPIDKGKKFLKDIYTYYKQKNIID